MSTDTQIEPISNPVYEQTLAEVIRQAGDPTQAMNELETTFRVLIAAAKDQGHAVVLNNAWQLACTVYEAAGAAFSLLVVAREVTAELQAQNDTLIDEHERIVTGLNDPDYAEHPLVKAAVEKIKEWEGEAALDEYSQKFEEWKQDEFDHMVEEAQDHAEGSIEDGIEEEIADTLGISEFEAGDVMELLRGDCGDITRKEAKEFID
jgi:hypothetical protein